MSRYSKEFWKLKQKVIDDLKEHIRQKESGELSVTASTDIKQSKRVLRSLMLSTDDTWRELVEGYLDPEYKFMKNKKSEIAGRNRIEQFKNVGRSLIERRLPVPLRRLETDRIHHGTPLEFAEVLEQMPADELLKTLQHYENQGLYFADSNENLRGGSFDEREHTGARPKRSQAKEVFPSEYGPEGRTDISAHPRGTNDPFYKVTDRPVTAADAIKILDPLLEQNTIDQDIARQVADPRRTWINDQLRQMGLIDEGVDIFSSDIDDATLKKIAPALKDPMIQRGAAEAFKTPSRIVDGTVHFNAVDPISAAMDPLMKNRIGALTGILFDGYNIDTIKKLEQGDVMGAGTDVARGAIGGAAIEAGAKALGPRATGALGAVAAPATGVALFNEGRTGSTTDYVLQRYGPNSQERPWWGMGDEAMDPNNPKYEKPGVVKAVEDAFDFVGGRVNMFFKGDSNRDYEKELGDMPTM